MKNVYYCDNIGDLREWRGFEEGVREIPQPMELYNKIRIIK